MKKNILLHGATNCKSSNYGDFIYAELLYWYITEKGFNVLFWQPSSFFINKLNNYIDKPQKTKMQSCALVYIPGGYFGEGHDAKFIENVIQFYRFMPIGLKFIKNRKTIGIIGIGAGPNNNSYLTWAIRKICNNALLITVRDKISFDAIKSICPQSHVYECSDLIIASSSKIKKYEKSEQINTLLTKHIGKKLLLVHFNSNIKALDLFVETLNSFIKDYPEYHIIVTSDNILKNENELFKRFVSKCSYDCSHFIYDDPAEMTTLLTKVDVVLTCKLHVGVVACLFNKSVIVAAMHPEKTKRFYSQIGEEARCVSLFDTSKDYLYAMLVKYHNKKIYIPQSEIIKAEQNWKMLDNFLEKL